MDNKPLNDELLRALAYYGAAGGSGGGGGGSGTNVYNDLLGKPVLTSQKYPSGVVVKDTKALGDYGIPQTLQEIFDLNDVQVVRLGTDPSIALWNTTDNTTLGLSPNDIVFISHSSNEQIMFRNDGQISGSINKIYNLVHSLEDLISSSVLVDVANWSATTTTINGIAYYTNVLNFTKVYLEHPEVTIDVMNNTDILPSKAQRDAYSLVTTSGYFNATLNNNRITCYSQVKPTSSFKIRVKGAK